MFSCYRMCSLAIECVLLENLPATCKRPASPDVRSLVKHPIRRARHCRGCPSCVWGGVGVWVCVCVCVCVKAKKQIQSAPSSRLPIVCVRACVRACVRVCVRVGVGVSAFGWVGGCLFVRTCTLHIYTCVCACVHVHLIQYTYKYMQYTYEYTWAPLPRGHGSM